MDTQIHVAGRGVAELSVPWWAGLFRALAAFGAFLTVLGAPFYASSWEWVASGFTTKVSLGIATTLTCALGALFWFFRGAAFAKLLNLRRVRQGEARRPKWVYGGKAGALGILVAATLAFSLPAAGIFLIGMPISESPLPDYLEKREIQVTPADPKSGLHPIHFWDYATWIDEAWLDHWELVLPYEKGPPEKLLSRVLIASTDTHTTLVELHGRRPRAYGAGAVHSIFDQGKLTPSDWPLAFQLQKEAGLNVPVSGPRTLWLFRLNHDNSRPTQAIGVPWGETKTRGVAGNFFFWGPEGSVFQVKCPEPCDGGIRRFLELVEFAPDPRGSTSARAQWTLEVLRKMLVAPPSAPEARLRHDRLLSFYLVSLLTLDPRDPEPFFHLGKLATNRATVQAAIRYGRDLGMDGARLAELQSLLQRGDRAPE